MQTDIKTEMGKSSLPEEWAAMEEQIEEAVITANTVKI